MNKKNGNREALLNTLSKLYKSELSDVDISVSGIVIEFSIPECEQRFMAYADLRTSKQIPNNVVSFSPDAYRYFIEYSVDDVLVINTDNMQMWHAPKSTFNNPDVFVKSYFEDSDNEDSAIYSVNLSKLKALC